MKSLCQSIKKEHGQSRVVHGYVWRFGMGGEDVGVQCKGATLVLPYGFGRG